ncbi:MAG TPA: hypothetical protein VLY65_00175 [Nitrososphaerales archaeon]|nr:hypothetical protein [Nitrososphaerales archaeon]
MKIRTAFPSVLKRQHPFVKPDYPLLVVLYLLRMTDLDAVPITYPDAGETRAVFGFSCLPRFMALRPGRFGKLLGGPCEVVSDKLNSIGVDEDLGTLLDEFASKRLGFDLVHGVGASKGRSSVVALTDFLELYERRTIHTELLAKEVASPMFSMPRTTPIRAALEAMFRNRYRRVFLSDLEYISDRSVTNYLFSPTVLEGLAQRQERDVLLTPIDKLEKLRPTVVPPYTSLRTAALKLLGDRGHCLVVGRGKVATPWDVVMKPWLTRKMTIGS